MFPQSNPKADFIFFSMAGTFVILGMWKGVEVVLWIINNVKVTW